MQCEVSQGPSIDKRWSPGSTSITALGRGGRGRHRGELWAWRLWWGGWGWARVFPETANSVKQADKARRSEAFRNKVTFSQISLAESWATAWVRGTRGGRRT